MYHERVMILGDTMDGRDADMGTTLDEILRVNAARRPDAIALVDPPNRATFTDGEPRFFTYAQADRVVSAIAQRLRGIGLPADSIVAMQFANTSESILSLLGVLRAGMIAAPMPMLWRRADCVTALSRIGTKALMTCARIGDTDHAGLAMQIAAEIFPIRHVCGFGASLPEGFTSFEDVFGETASGMATASAQDRRDSPALHIAVITFDTTAEGVVPVARNHAELLAGGLAVLSESRLTADSIMLSSLPAASFAGIALTLVPWLISGGTLRLHQPFDAPTLSAQLQKAPCNLAILPGSLVARLAEAEIFGQPHGPKNILAFWRGPERLALSPPWFTPDVNLTDVVVFGEIGLCAIPRTEAAPPRIPAGKVRAPHGKPSAVIVADIARTPAGTLGFGGPMVPRHAFPPQVAKSFASYFEIGDDGTIDTGYPCRADAGGLVVTGPPAGLVSMGGYRFALRDVQNLVTQADKNASVVALPDTFAGYRLAGHSKDRSAMRHTLAAIGLNPLIVRAFRDRTPAPSAARWHDGFHPGR
jgi:non-ribosomal peptide synthetase component E (peptide arylation enzyme)